MPYFAPKGLDPTGFSVVEDCFTECVDPKTNQASLACIADCTKRKRYPETQDISDCWDRWSTKCRADCYALYVGNSWFPDWSGHERCTHGCQSHLIACQEKYIPSILPLKCDSPRCNDYAPSDEYSGTNARCFCKCAGNSDWAMYVRGCLRELYDKGVDSHHAHMLCYSRADGLYKRPTGTLLNCAAQCFNYSYVF